MTLAEFRERLRAVADRRMQEAALAAGTEYGKGLEARARARAPRRSGRLAGSVTSSATPIAGGDVRVEGQAGAGLRYGRMQEFGGSVRGNPLLAVGMAPGAAGRGFFVLTARDGRLFLARKVGRTVVLAARLAPGVRIRGSHFMRDAQRLDELKAGVVAGIKRVLSGR